MEKAAAYLSESEKTRENLDRIAREGGFLGGMLAGFASLRPDDWTAHGYTTTWVATNGVGNEGSQYLVAVDPKSPQAKLIAYGQAARVRAMVEKYGVERCLQDGNIYDGRETVAPQSGIIDDDWAFATDHYIPFPSTNWRTRIRLVPRSASARLLYLHARYEKIISEGDYDQRIARAVWRLLNIASKARTSATNSEVAYAARTAHLTASSWDRHPPYSHAAAEAWARKWNTDAPGKLAYWPVAKKLHALAAGGAA